MEERCLVSKEDRMEIKDEFLSNGFTLEELSDELGFDFKNFVYKGTSLERSDLESLEDFISDSIDFEIVYFVDGGGFQARIEVERSKYLAELIGYVLGDGCVSSYVDKEKGYSNHYVAITLHEDEGCQKERVLELFQRCLNYEPAVEDPKDKKIVHLKAYGKRFVEFFNSVGLESGNKVENQISVPEWIYHSEDYIKCCLRGLIDTDGSVYERDEDGYIVVNFKNRSKNLLEDFSKMNEEIGINVSLCGEYDRQIASQKDVKKFFEIVSPLKSKKDSIQL